MRSKKAILASIVVAAGAIVGIGQVTDTFPVVGSACSCPTPTFPPQNTVAPQVSGNVQVGQGVIAATDGTWTHSPTSFTYAWQSSPTGAGSWSALGDTDNLYTLVTGDVGNYVRIEITAINAQGSAVSDSNVLGPITAAGGGGGGPSDTLANVWVSQAGSDNGANCGVRSSVATTEPNPNSGPGGVGSTSVCKTMDKAYRLANCGDNILIDGTLTANQLIPFGSAKTCSNTAGCRESLTYGDNTTSTQSYVSCVTFQFKNGVTGTLGAHTSSGGAAAIGIEVPYVRLINLSTQLAQGNNTTAGTDNPIIRIGANSGRTGGPCSQWNVHDVIVKGLTSASFTAAAVNYVTVEDGNFGPSYASQSSPNFVNACTVSGATTVTLHFAMVHNVIHDYIQDTAANGTPPAHLEGIHWQGGSSSLMSRNIFKNITQQDISLQTNCGSGATVCAIDDILIENNVFDTYCSDPAQPAFCLAVSGGGTTFICDNSVDEMKNITVRYNSYDAGLGSGTPSMQSTGCSSLANFGPFTYLGNIIRGCPGVSGVTVTYTYNVSFSGTCTGTGNSVNAVASSIYTDPSYPNFDWTEKATSTGTIDFVPFAQGAPSVDLTGATRPDSPGTAFDAGAYESSAGS